MDKHCTCKSVRAAFEERFGKLTERQSEDEIAEQTGIYPLEVRRWIYGELPYVRQLPRIADAYGVSIDHLLGRTEEKEPAPAAVGQAQKEKNIATRNVNSIAQTSEVVNNFTYFLPILMDFARQYFGDINVQHISAHDDVNSDSQSVDIEFVSGDGYRYRILLESVETEEE